MAPALSLWNQILIIIGEVTLVVLLLILLVVVMMVTLAVYSFRKGRLIFPRLLKAGLLLVEGLSKALFGLFGLEDREVQTFFVQLHNTLNRTAFAMVPVESRAIFLPQCIRSAQCPAHLTPEGIECRACGACDIAQMRRILTELGYQWFVVPGSTFIKRMVKQYRPQALIGVGCLNEVKDGLEMADKIGIVAMGVVNLTDGCVETIVDWDQVFDVALLGIAPDLVSQILRDARPRTIPPG
jgi:hypothetical protein